MSDPQTTNLGLFTPANGADSGTWDVPVNANWATLDTAFGGAVIINVVGVSGTTALTQAQYRNRSFVFSGALTANVTYQVPTGVGGFWSVVNATSGAFTLTLSSGGAGASVICPQGFSVIVFSDGTNIRFGQNAPYAAPGADKDVIFNSSGSYAANAGFTFDGTTVTASEFSGDHEGTINNAATIGTGGPLVGFRNIPLSANTTPDATDVGKMLVLTAGATVSAGVFKAGDAFMIVNRNPSAANIVINQGTGVVLVVGGTTTTGNRTIAANGFASFLCTSLNFFIVSGPGLS